MNPEKLAKLQAQVRTGGKGTPRRKIVSTGSKSIKEDPKLASTLKQLDVQPIPEVETINMFKDDGKVIGFSAPRLSANIHANTFVITGKPQEKTPEQALTEMISRIGSFGPESLSQLAKMTEGLQVGSNAADIDDDIPDLVASADDATESKTDLDAAD
ncbi:transcription factor BTF3-like protein 4-like protein [Kickxella alabastrina]|uniref:Nascent polypeptide-associated complex subunit beta n=1 Tax=Kickxella alabastrina TaxID=61397 RepID=A0ACC1I6J1_9FUNG|nr:transcription factor BTF3-like protein 4-like protein [Kickxella alabastrina]KAI7829975.1 transcription factor BTF3-like protein 4-like protein [Kickxella alabastrina]KAJ1888587.1 Nascent polypeptide-associated complex subunit beta [Kickxella alabastrina]KAJ1937499.1 Nascent polypeptide-associated complex subunit beta [Kickxella alabastrina]